MSLKLSSNKRLLSDLNMHDVLLSVLKDVLWSYYPGPGWSIDGGCLGSYTGLSLPDNEFDTKLFKIFILVLFLIKFISYL